MGKPATHETDVPREYMAGDIGSAADAAYVAVNPPNGESSQVLGGVLLDRGGWGVNAKAAVYNCKGDGVTDDTTGLLAWLAAAAGTGSGSGKRALLPTGVYVHTSQITATDCMVDGAGLDHAVLKCTAALGAGVPAVILARGSGSERACQMQGLSLLGPSICNLGGPRTAGVDGLRIDNKAVIRDVRVTSFDSGIVFNTGQGHITLQNVESTANYYGVYDITGTGDHFFIDSTINGNKFANIALLGNKSAPNWVIERTHVGFAPYGIYHETDGAPAAFMLDCTLVSAHFEAIGNVAIFDENFASGANPTFNGNTIINPAHNFNNTYKIGARIQDYAIKVGYVGYQNVTFAGQDNFKAGSAGVLYVNSLNASWIIFGGQTTDVFSPASSGYWQTFSRYGEVQINDLWLQGPTALGGGAAPTLGTIGGTGPAVAAQNSWVKIRVGGTNSYIPIWR